MTKPKEKETRENDDQDAYTRVYIMKEKTMAVKLARCQGAVGKRLVDGKGTYGKRLLNYCCAKASGRIGRTDVNGN